MSSSIQQRQAFSNQPQEVEEYDTNLIQDLGRRLGCVWEYDRLISNADGRPDLQEFWRRAQSQEQKNVERLKHLLH